ncbi:hypothetical protein KX816_11685 [Sphingosinicellaceae bacterium]|nr:hypothetical protein KX816_11685 [Sphingosinicellaceae bacterium]
MTRDVPDDAPLTRLLPLILLACVTWVGVAGVRGWMHWTGSLGDGLDIAAAVLPPIVGALFAVALFRRARRPEYAGVENRLAAAGSEAMAIEGRLRALDATLGGSLAQAERMAEAASAHGSGLGASATALGLAATRLVDAGEDADRAAALLAERIPDLGRQVGELDAVLRRLGSDTAQQILAIDTLLAKVGVRSRETGAEAGAVIGAIVKQLAAVDEHSKDTTSALAKRAYALDAAIDGVLERSVTALDDVGTRIAGHTDTLEQRLGAVRLALDEAGEHGTRVIGERLDRLIDAADRLKQLFAAQEVHSAGLIEQTDLHLTTLPARLDEARSGSEAVLASLNTGIGAVNRNLQGLQGPLGASGTAIGALAEQLDLLRRIADELGVGLAGRLPATVAELRNVDAGAVALVQRVDGLRDTLLASSEATRTIRELVGATRLEMATLGEADARQVGERIAALDLATRNLGEQIVAQGELSARTSAGVVADLDAVQTRLGAAKLDGDARLMALADHIGSVHTAIDDLGRPLGSARTVLDDIDGQIANFSGNLAAFGDGLDARLANSSKALDALTADAGGLLERTDALHAAIGQGAAAIGGAAEAFARERGHLAEGAEVLAGHFDRARAVLEGIRTGTAKATEDASERLGPIFERARGLAEQGAAAMHDMLGRVVADAERALERSSSTIVEAAFATPIRTQLTAIEDAAARLGTTAEAAVERVGGQTRALHEAIENVADKVAEIEVRIEVRARDTLSARSTRLIEQLGEASVDVSKLLAVDVGENAWVDYLGGDRSVFARRTVKLVDRDMARKIARHYQHDAAFRDEASRYLDTFEKLTRRILTDPDGDALMATIVSSDLGKLYVAIARSTGRLTPAAAAA